MIPMLHWAWSRRNRPSDANSAIATAMSCHAQTGSNNSALQEGGKENTPPCKRRKSAACLNFNSKTASQQANRSRADTSSLLSACIKLLLGSEADKVKGDSFASSEAAAAHVHSGRTQGEKGIEIVSPRDLQPPPPEDCKRSCSMVLAICGVVQSLVRTWRWAPRSHGSR